MRQRRPDLPIPEALDQTVMKCLKKRVNERPKERRAAGAACWRRSPWRDSRCPIRPASSRRAPAHRPARSAAKKPDEPSEAERQDAQGRGHDEKVGDATRPALSFGRTGRRRRTAPSARGVAAAGAGDRRRLPRESGASAAAPDRAARAGRLDLDADRLVGGPLEVGESAG